MMEAYGEHDDPIVVLDCGHFYGIDTLDGYFELHQAYEKSAETGAYLATKPMLNSNVSERPKQCPACRAPVTSARRYGRILKLAALRSLERKHRTYIEDTLKELSVGKRENLKTLRMLRREVDYSPIHRVQDACRSLKNASDVEVPDPEPSLLLKILDMTANEHSSRVKEANSQDYKMADKVFLEAIDIATQNQSWRTASSLRLDYAGFLWRWMSSGQSMWDNLDWVNA